MSPGLIRMLYLHGPGCKISTSSCLKLITVDLQAILENLISIPMVDDFHVRFRRTTLWLEEKMRCIPMTARRPDFSFEESGWCRPLVG